jgi:glycine cleavage system H protein
MKVPANLKYTETDEWILVEGNMGTIGITDFAQDQLSDIVFLEITAAVDDELAKGDAYGEIESVKAASEVNMPVDGVVREINEGLTDKPEKVNDDPYGEAWMLKFEITDPSQIEDLIDAPAYEKYCKERET